MDTQLPIDNAQLDLLGQRLFRIWPTYKADRKQIEERWLQNLRQVRGIYDPKVARMIPSDRSKAYPKMTAWMVRGTIARLMQMLFPQTEKNYGVKASPMPDLPTDQLQQVLDALVAERAAGGDPAQVVLTDIEIEKAIREFARGKAERMELKVDDDLQEMEFVTLARKVVRSATIYNIGILEGPFHKTVKSRTWTRNEFTGKYTAVEIDKYKPMFEFQPVWGYYPDMTAVDITRQDGEFMRRVMTRAEVQELAGRSDFLGGRITEYLNKNTEGNYQELWWESEIKGEPKSAQAVVQGKPSRKFEVLSYWGGITGAELRAAGSAVPEEDLGKMFIGNVWMIDSLVIKAKLAPLGENIRRYHIFVFEDDDMSILGNGLCDTLRDSQVSLCETVRAALDNASVIGPMAEVNVDMLVPGQNTSIEKHKTWRRQSDGGQADGIPAVRNISIDSHLNELLPLIQLFLGFGDKESGLPPASLGDTSQGGSEALRTQRNASMFLGAAALPVRDTVRNYDSFTMSVISALVEWNKRYDANPGRDGDHNTIARGSTSLIAKEVLAQSLEAFRAGLAPDELPHVKVRALLMARAKANDIPVDELMEDEDKAEEIIQRNAQAQAQQAQQQGELVGAQIKRELATALEREAKARGEDSSISVGVFKTIIDALKAGDAAETEKTRTALDAANMMTTKQGGESV